VKLFNKPHNKKRGAALVEYGLIVAGVALVAAAAVSIFGKKTSDMIGAAAAVLPGAQAQDNGAITSGRLIETTDGSQGAIQVDSAQILSNSGENRLGDNLGLDLSQLVTDNSQGGGSNP
jgi:Flp pilus assembly pilin Flp